MGKIIIRESQLNRLFNRIQNNDLQENSTERVTLRKLTWKSKWDFGPKYSGATMAEIYAINPSAILWLYLNYEKISFVDEVLEKLKERFPNLELIQKPGSDKQQYEEIVDSWNIYKDKTYPELLSIIRAKRINKDHVSKQLIKAFNEKKAQHKIDKDIINDPFRNVDSKEKMARKNQGHKD